LSEREVKTDDKLTVKAYNKLSQLKIIEPKEADEADLKEEFNEDKEPDVGEFKRINELMNSK
jgi:hypothetical protein